MESDKKSSLNLLKAVKRPELRKFIDLPKFYRSDEFNELLEVVCSHAVITRDTGRLREILILFDGSRFLEDVASKIKSRSGFLVRRELGDFKFSSLKPGNEKASVEQLASEKHSLLVRSSDKKIDKKWGGSGVDALDHWSRLPGSYGAGKRR